MEYGIIDFLTLVGSLGLFLYGMKLMSEALQKVAGNKMRSILASMTSTRLMGVLTGILITATIQSSSATTVMVVSFVNAGLLSLIESIGVIMGANIGTTVTAWLISILGFKVKISAIALPLIGLALPLIFSKNNKRKSWGEFVIGFAIIFMGLELLKSSVPDIKNNPEILSFLAAYSDMGFASILLFLFIGTILTVIIQSSSAVMALTLVMCHQGWISFEIAAAMVLGENIGTTITANIAAFVANVSAKRAAFAHLVFNVIGVVWLLSIFPFFLKGIDLMIIKMGMTSPFSNPKSVPISLSIFHTTFNILNALIFVSFARLIERISIRMVKSKNDEDEAFKLKHIETGLLATPELSILQAKKEIAIYGEITSRMLKILPDMLTEKNKKTYTKLYERIQKYEKITNKIEIEIAEYLTSVAQDELSNSCSHKIRTMLKIIDDIESIGDVCAQMAHNIDQKNEQKIWFSQDIRDNLFKIFDLTNDALVEMNSNLNKDFENVSIDKANQLETEINQFRDQLREMHVAKLEKKGYPNYHAGLYYNNLFSLCEKMGDYIINVSEAIEYYNKDKN